MRGSKEAEFWRGTTVVTDPAWGDCGKGKVTDEGARYVNLIGRFNGGPNAGHTVQTERGEKYILHTIPSGILNPNALCIVTTGVVVNPLLLADEIRQLRTKGVDISSANLLLSQDAHLIMPWHRMRDALGEKARGGTQIGTTGQGIGPTYADRAARVGLRVGDLFVPNFEEVFDQEFAWQERLTRVMDGELLVSDLHNTSIDRRQMRTLAKSAAEREYYDRDAMWEQLREARDIIGPMVTNVLPIIWKYEDEGKNILGEAGQGALLDLDLGGYPYVTSSHPGRAGFSLATGINTVDRVIGVTKAYATRVGEGPMPTELHDEKGEYLQREGREVGATTGRKRRCGWLDIPAVRYGARISGVDRIALTKLDVLDGLGEINICIGYRLVDGREYKELPTADPRFVSHARPVYETMPGWRESTTNARSFNELPQRAQEYVQRVRDHLKLPICMVSVGPRRDATIYP